MALRSPGSTSASMISQRKSCRIRSESNPQNSRTKGTHFWESQKGQNSKAGMALDKILFRLVPLSEFNHDCRKIRVSSFNRCAYVRLIGPGLLRMDKRTNDHNETTGVSHIYKA